MYGNIISENEDNIKSQRVFFAIYGVIDKTIGTQASDVAVGSNEYAGSNVNTAYIQLVFEGYKSKIAERILLFADIYKVADGEIRRGDNPKSSRAHRWEISEIAGIAPTRRYATS